MNDDLYSMRPLTAYDNSKISQFLYARRLQHGSGDLYYYCTAPDLYKMYFSAEVGLEGARRLVVDQRGGAGTKIYEEALVLPDRDFVGADNNVNVNWKELT